MAQARVGRDSNPLMFPTANASTPTHRQSAASSPKRPDRVRAYVTLRATSRWIAFATRMATAGTDRSMAAMRMTGSDGLRVAGYGVL